MKNKLAIAQIVKPQGIKGEVKLKSLGDGPDMLLDVEGVYLSGDMDKKVSVKKAWRYKDSVFMALDGISDRNQAEALRGQELYIDADDAAELEDGFYYVSDLIGCTIAGHEGTVLGVLKNILQHGAADVYVVEGEKSFMMPALKRVILKTDIETKTITVDEEALAEVAVYEN